jgi:hypothetical protein
MAKVKIYKTLILLTVLSDRPLQEGMSIADIDAECEDGDFTGKTDWQEVNTVLEGKEAADAVRDTGSSTDFFQMDEDGNELNDDEESGPFDQLGYEQTTEE